MISLLLFIVLLVMFFYFTARMSALEIRVKKLQERELSKPQPTMPTAPIPHSAIPEVMGQSQSTESVLRQQVDRNFEIKFGGKFFTGIGALAVLLGVGFFLRFAFEQNLITETMRIVLGLIVGAILIGAGEYLRKKYDQYGQVLQGTGIGVFYLTFFAAYDFYALIGQPAAFVALILVTLGGVWLSVRANSFPLAGVALLGAYMTPFLVGYNIGDPNKLFIYILLVNIGSLLLAMWRSWRLVTLCSLFGTAIVYVAWHANSYVPTDVMWHTSMIYLTLFFLTFLSANIYRYFIQKQMSDENDLALVLFNPLFYFLATYSVLHPVNPDYVGWFALILGAVYVALGIAIPNENKDTKIFHFGVASIMLFIGIPILLDKQWITIGWAAEAAFILYYAMERNLKGLKYLAHVLYMIAALRLLSFDFIDVQGTQAILNGRALSFLVVAGLLILSAWHYYRKEQVMAVAGTPKTEDHGFEVLVLECLILLVIWTSGELMKFGNTYFMGIVWSGLSLITLLVGIQLKNYELRIMAYGTAIFAVLRVFIFDSSLPGIYENVMNFRALSFIGVAVVIGLMLYILKKFSEVLREDERKNIPRAMFVTINFLLLTILTLEINTYFELKPNTKRAALSVAWSLYAGVLLVIGIARKSAISRLLAMVLFSIVIFKVFLYDTANLSNFYRFVSFITLGVILLLAGYLYNRHKDRIAEFIQIK